MKSVYTGPWDVKKVDRLAGNKVVATWETFTRARDESLRLNYEHGTTDLFYVVPAGTKDDWR